MIRHVNRRTFLRRSIAAALGGAGLYSQFGNLQMVGAATRGTTFPDYKALVCVYLFGGNDSFNTVIPQDTAHHNIYLASRPALAIPRASLQQTILTPQAAQPGLPGGLPSDGATYALHPAMPELRGLFNQQRACIIGNVGTLIGSLTQAQYQNHTHPVPAQLFSHDDQTNFWQTSRPDDANADGWGGRIADMLHAGNPGTQIPMTISLSGQTLFQRGQTIDQYVMGAYGVPPIDYLESYQNDLGAQTFHALNAAGTQAHMFERAYAGATRRAIATYESVNATLDAATPPTTVFPDTYLGAQLKQVANLINVRSALGMQRQIFYVSIGGFDTHDSQVAIQAAILADLSQSLRAFYDATVELGLASNVTTFTASDFGRTVSTNGDGTDHGWGGHHFVLGGAVHGGRFFGTMPSLAQTGNTDDAGYGQLIPTTGVDQYSATLASWFGVDAGGIADLFPNLGEYTTPANIGFMA